MLFVSRSAFLAWTEEEGFYKYAGLDLKLMSQPSRKVVRKSKLLLLLLLKLTDRL
jgi:hypothetical protein